MSFSASADLSFLSLCGSKVQTRTMESAKPAATRELSSEILTLVTREATFIKLYIQMEGTLSGPRFALLKDSRRLRAFSCLSVSFISGNGIRVDIGAFGSFLDFLAITFSFFFFFFDFDSPSPSSSSSICGSGATSGSLSNP